MVLEYLLLSSQKIEKKVGQKQAVEEVEGAPWRGQEGEVEEEDSSSH